MRIRRRAGGVLVIVGLLIAGLAPGAFAAAEDTLLSRLNEARRAHGLAPLESHRDLVDDAEAHSARMMAADDLHHNPDLGSVTTGWLALGENVGVGPTARSIHNAFMESPPHRGNILGDFTHVGIGAVRASEHKLWVTVVFMKARNAPAPTTTTTTTTTQPPATTTTPPPTTTTAPPVATVPPTTTTSPPPVVVSNPPAQSEPGWTAHVVRLRNQPRPL